MAFEIKSGDTRPLFIAALKDNYGEITEAPVDLTTAAGVAFNMRETGGTITPLNAAAGTITNAAAGEITYPWGTADTSTSGNFYMEAEVTWGDGRIETFPGGPSGTDDGSGYWPVLITDRLA